MKSTNSSKTTPDLSERMAFPPSADFLRELVADAAAQAMDGQFIIWVDDNMIDDKPKEFIFNLLEDTVIYMGVD
ncbi:hypothetical protein [Lacticaseibacillus paracasei]|uniref:hypothetical protein n=1 Tax=Lacticaseibacillus paracasei TaxID=1597 RepID=UPI0024417CBD|nr:hypothetical protein [Lacticaseibacillus paracasei]